MIKEIYQDFFGEIEKDNNFIIDRVYISSSGYLDLLKNLKRLPVRYLKKTNKTKDFTKTMVTKEIREIDKINRKIIIQIVRAT